MTISCKAWKFPAEYPRWVARCDIKGSDGTIFKYDILKEGPGPKNILGGEWLQNAKYLV